MADIVRSIEPFELTQGFGENPAAYARFNLKGHNGWDFRTKFSDTPLGHRDILASWLSSFYRTGNEGNDGFGKYFEVVVKLKSTWKLTYAHCLELPSFVTKQEGESMAISDNTGNSTGAHLHLTVKRITIVNGVHNVQDYNNGYFGAVDPQQFFDEVRAAKKAGVTPTTEGGLTMQIEEKDFTKLVTNSNERDAIRGYLGVPLDPLDAEGKKAKEVIDGLRNVATGLQRQLVESQTREQNKVDELARYKQSAEQSANTDADRIKALLLVQKSLEKEKESLADQLEEHSTAEGNAKIEAGQWKTKYEQAIAGTTTSLTIGDVLILLWQKISPIKLKQS